MKKRAFVSIAGKRVPFSDEPFVRPREDNLALSFLSDKPNMSFVIRNIFDRATERWYRGWKRNTVPIALLCSARGCSRRTKLMRRCAAAEFPIILIYADGGVPGQGICPDSFYRYFPDQWETGPNVIPFAWTNAPSLRQLSVLYFLIDNWPQVPYNAIGWLQSIPFISVDKSTLEQLRKGH
jgi:hypothetical protein